MLEIIILTLIVVAAFIGVSWYSYKRSQERAASFEKELDLGGEHNSKAFQQRFDALFEEQLHGQSGNNVDDEPQPDLFTPSEQAMTDTPQEVASENDTSLDAESIDEPSEPSPVSEDVEDWDMVIALTIMATENAPFSGRAVINTLDRHELHFGEMQIYHRFASDNHKQPLFSVANILDPGVLLPDKLFASTTPGLLIFARLPGPVSGMALFDEMLDTALGMSSQLGGVLCDDQRQPITQEGLEDMRGRILSYQMSLQTQNQQTNDYNN